MNAYLWCAFAFIAAACVIDVVCVARYHRQLDDLRADRDEDRDRLDVLTANAAEHHDYLAALATEVIGTEQPSTGRHAHNTERNAA